MKLKYPKVHTDQNQQVYISFYLNEKRYRLFNGKRIGSETKPNSYPTTQRFDVGNVLAAEVYDYLINGGVIKSFRSENILAGKLTDRDYLKMALETKLRGTYSEKYKKMLQYMYDVVLKFMKEDSLTKEAIKKYLDAYSSGVSHNTIRRHLNVLINEAINQGMSHNPMESIKSRKSNAKLHKPFKNISVVLDEVESYNKNLYLCCLLTYGCLLRPHREIRELTWGDFTDDLSHIKLSGNRNKSGRNRIVPVPSYIKNQMVLGESNHNIFSGMPVPYNADYFKSLWSRFKTQTNILDQAQTLYSFRHSGAIEIFKRTGSITKLQKAMGHSSINVSLTYLRGLEVAELTEDDMPRV